VGQRPAENDARFAPPRHGESIDNVLFQHVAEI
jgi:hypothetical protein